MTWAVGDKAYLLTAVSAMVDDDDCPILDPTSFEVTQVTVREILETHQDSTVELAVDYESGKRTTLCACFLLTEEQAKKFDSSLGKPGGWRVP